MEWSIFEHEHPFVKIESNCYEEIPYLCVTPKNMDGGLPTIIYYHGWHSSKEFKRFEAMMISSFGYRVIVPDALYHGERGSIDYDDPESLDRYLWEIIANSVTESDRFFAHLQNNYGIEDDQIVVMGSSMGAMTAAGVFAKHQKIRGVATISGANAWSRAIEQGVMPKAGAYAELVEKFDLLEHKERIGKRPVLILHGVDDKPLPVDLQREFLKAVKTTATDVQMVEYDDVGHRFTMNMMQKLMMWLNEMSNNS